MDVLKKFWKTIERNRTKKNEWLKKLFKYQHIIYTQWLRDNENYFSETKELFKWNKNE